jgi:hypothetical protein
MTHLAIWEGPGPEAAEETTWGDHVTDAEYRTPAGPDSARAGVDSLLISGMQAGGMRSDPVPVPVAVHAVDAISRAGVQSLLSLRPEVRLAGPAAPGVVHVVIVDSADELALARVRRLGRRTWVPRAGIGVGPVVVVPQLPERDIRAISECGVSAIVLRHEATGGHLARVIQAVARGDHTEAMRFGSEPCRVR